MNDKGLKLRSKQRTKQVWMKDEKGDPKQIRLSYPTATYTAREAQRAYVADLAKINAGKFVASKPMTVRQYVTSWLTENRHQFAGKTWERFESIARIHLIPKLGNFRLQDLRPGQLTRAYADWRSQGLSGQTVVHHHRLIHRILAQAVRERLITENVASIAQKPKAPKAEMRVLNAQEIDAVLKAREGTPFGTLILLGLSTGARRGELLGLKWDDYDTARSTLAIRRSLEQTKAGVTEKTPKNGKARVIKLPEVAIQALRRHRIAQARIGGYLFPGIDGEAWAPHKVTDGFRQLCRKVKIAGATFHTLRHTCASLLLAQGVHPKVVQEMLGHSTIAITMDLYSHSTPSLQDEAALRLDDALRGRLAGRAGAGI